MLGAFWTEVLENLPFFLGKPEILFGESNGSPYSVWIRWEASENIGCDLRGCHLFYSF